MRRLFGAAALILALPTIALAGSAAVPEIDMSAAPAGLVFLGAAVAILRGRRQRP